MRPKRPGARESADSEAEAARLARAVATLGHHADQYKSAKIAFYPPQQYPQARDIAALFRSAGWKTRFNETPQEPFAMTYFEGIEVSGFNSPLVESVGRALSEAGVPAVRTVLHDLAVAPENPKYPYSLDSVRITVGHIRPDPAAINRRTYRRALPIVAVLISATVSVLTNLATEWKTNHRMWFVLVVVALVWAAVEWIRDER